MVWKSLETRTWIVTVEVVSMTPPVRVLNGLDRFVKSRCCVMTTCLTPSVTAATRPLAVDTYLKLKLSSPLSSRRPRNPSDAGRKERSARRANVVRDKK